MNRIDQDIKSGEFHRLYLLYGGEAYLKLQYRDKLKKALLPPDDTMNFNRFEGAKTDPKELIGLSETLPFFADRRVILAENTGFFKKADDELTEYFSHIPETTVFVFVEDETDGRSKALKAAKAVGICEEMTLPDDATLGKWIAARLTKVGKKMKSDAWEEFLLRVRPEGRGKKNASGDTMLRMDREIEKLIAFTWDKDVIEKADVEEICTGQLESKVFEMIDAIAAKNPKRVMERYRELLLQKQPPAQILALIERQFRQMLLVREMNKNRIDAQTIAQRAGIPSFAVSKNLSLSRSFSEDTMRALLADAQDFEQKIKTGRLNDRMAVELLMTGYAK